MKLSKKSVFLPVLVVSLLTGSAFSNTAPQFVYELLTPKQATVIAATTTALFGGMAWAINEDINTEISRVEKKHKKNTSIHPLARLALVTLPSALIAGTIGAAMYVGITLENVDQYLKDTTQLNEAITKTTQEILLGSGI